MDAVVSGVTTPPPALENAAAGGGACTGVLVASFTSNFCLAWTVGVGEAKSGETLAAVVVHRAPLVGVVEEDAAAFEDRLDLTLLATFFRG